MSRTFSHRSGPVVYTTASRSDVVDWRAPKLVSSSLPHVVDIQKSVSYSAIGMILYTVTSKGIKYALVKRRVSYGLHTVLTANLGDKTCFAELSDAERTDLLDVCDMKEAYEETFRRLWQDAWWGKEAVCEEFIQRSLKRFISMRHDIRNWIIDTPSIFPNGVWGFPKGKNDKHQNEVMCALREVYEETGLLSASLTIKPCAAVVENFKQWTYKYFIAEVKNADAFDKLISSSVQMTMKSEVSEVVWRSFGDALDLIPRVMQEKRDLLTSLHIKLATR